MATVRAADGRAAQQRGASRAFTTGAFRRPHDAAAAVWAEAAAGDGKPADPTRARQPDARGVAPSGEGWVAWETFAAGDPPIVFVPPWQIVHSRVWKAQVPDFARRHRVVTWDARGNGRSDRPIDPAAHTTQARAADLGRVMDAACVADAVLVGLSGASGVILAFAAEHPERVRGIVLVSPSSPFGLSGPRDRIPFEEPLDDDDGWNKENVHFWRRDFRAYLEHFFDEAIPERHSTKQRGDGVAWGLDTDPETLAATVRASSTLDADAVSAMCSAIRCPTLVIQGTDDRISHVTQGAGLARAIPGAQLELIDGGGHMPNARDPVRVNLAIRDFIGHLPLDPR